MSPLTYIFGLPLLAALLMVLIPRNFRFVIRCPGLAGHLRFDGHRRGDVLQI